MSCLSSMALLRTTVLNMLHRYYNICNTTNPASLPAAIKVPWAYYPRCESTLAGADCSGLGFGLSNLSVSSLYSTLLPNGTATQSNEGGFLTSPPYGSTTAWYFFGSTGSATTATAAPYTTGKQGAQGAQGAQSTQGSSGSASKIGPGSPSSTSSGAASGVAKVKGATALFWIALGLCLA